MAAVAGDPAVLRSYLSAQRRHVLGILDGLDDEQLRRPALPSGWSCLGLVQHLTADVERFWFTAVMGGDQPSIQAFTADDAPDAWVVAEGTSAQPVMDAYRTEIQRSDAVIGRLSLRDDPAWWPQHFGTWRLDDLQDVMLHVITETACHAGHLDAARELIDGTRWMVLD